MEEKSILIQRKYGAVRLRLAEIMDSRGMTRNQLSRLTGTRYEVIHKWYGGKVENWIWMFWHGFAMCWIVKFLTCWFMKKRKNNKRKPVYFHGKTPAFSFIFFRKYEVFLFT